MDAGFIIGFFLWPLIIAATIWLNWYRITKRKLKPHYLSANYSRAFFAAICLFLMVPEFDPLGNWWSWLQAFPSMVYIVSSFYLFFDAGLNWLRDLKWDYRGEASGWLDSMKLAIYYCLKALCFVAMIWSIIMIWR